MIGMRRVCILPVIFLAWILCSCHGGVLKVGVVKLSTRTSSSSSPSSSAVQKVETHPALIHFKNLRRKVEFWKRAGRIYFSYKLFQLRRRLFPRKKSSTAVASRELLADEEDNLFHDEDDGKGEEKEEVDPEWEHIHEINSQRMIDLCLSLRGFYLKSGQFLSTRHDFMPSQYTTKLARLQDKVPPLSAEQARRIVEKELRGSIESYFDDLDLDHPIGSASIGQVHQGHWKDTKEKVAVKLQHPEAEVLMKSDLENLSRVARFLQRTELKFDLSSAVLEMRRQIAKEFDFEQEAQTMDFMSEHLTKAIPKLFIPKTVWSSRRLLVMTFAEGESLSQLAHSSSSSSSLLHMPRKAKQYFGRKLLTALAKVWGEQIFQLRVFHGDPHPGNILLSAKGIALVDWGQTKSLPLPLCKKFAMLVLALHCHKVDNIVEAFYELGMRVSRPDDSETVEAIATTMFDTLATQQFIINPFDPNAAIKKNRVLSMPPDLFFIVRTVQLLRGLSHAFGVHDFSLADQWMPYAKKTLHAIE